MSLQTGFDVRKYFVVAGKFGKKPGYFVAVRKSS
jgi:hypothetical protein